MKIWAVLAAVLTLLGIVAFCGWALAASNDLRLRRKTSRAVQLRSWGLAGIAAALVLASSEALGSAVGLG